MKIAKAAYPGERHRKINKSCGDVVDGITKENCAYIALADGASGKKHGHKTAKLAIEAIGNYANNLLENDLFPAGMEQLVPLVNEYLLGMGILARDMGTTLLFAFVQGDQYYIGHIGDGIIIADFGQGWHVVSFPENGYFVNETYLLPSKNITSHFRSVSGKFTGDGCIILASDGLSFTLFDPETSNISNACDTMRGWCLGDTQEKCEEILSHNLKTVFDSYSDDDKSLAILTYTSAEY